MYFWRDEVGLGSCAYWFGMEVVVGKLVGVVKFCEKYVVFGEFYYFLEAIFFIGD